jgi:hypothetical protein
MKVRRILISIALLLAAIILISVIRHYQLRDATNAYISKLKAQGEPMDLAQVLPPHLPPEENSAEALRKSAALIKADHSRLATNYYYLMKMVAPGRAMVGFQQREARDLDVTNSWGEVTAALAENKALFPLLWSVIEKPRLDFDVNYGNGIDGLEFTNLYLSDSKRAAQHLQVAALNDLHRGEGSFAVTNTRAMLAIVNGMADERLMISELVRIAIAHMAMAATWEILQSTNVSDEQLAALQKDWSSLEFFRAQENALNMERASGRITLKKWRASNSELAHSLFIGEQLLGVEPAKLTAVDRFRLKSRFVRWRYWWSYTDELRQLKGFQVLLAAPRATSTNDALLPLREDLMSDVLDLGIPPSNDFPWLSDPMKTDMHFVLSSSIVSLSGVFKRAVAAETAKRLTISAIALKRYHVKHIAYPPSLTAFVPESLPGVPRDPIDGQPLRYRLNPDGTFLLYSIGDDGKDDGGDPTSAKASDSVQWQRGRDWVWPQPATAEEIQKFYATPPK